MYCADNYISCSIIYVLNISGLILVTGILMKNREYYFREWKRIRQVIKDYTIDYRSEVNLPVFAKFIGVLVGFAILIVTSVVSIILWDMSFGFMEVSNIFLWTLCVFIFYVDYRSSFKFSKQLRIVLAIILAIQVTSGIVFGIERNQEQENRGFNDVTVEASAYLCNAIIMLIINIVSGFFPNFDYEKISKNSDDNNFISFNTLKHNLVSEDSLGTLNNEKLNQQQNSKRQSIASTPKRSSSFLDQLDGLTQDSPYEQQNPQGHSSSIQKLKEEQSGLIDPTYGLKREDEAIQKEKEQKELMDQIMNMHKQLDEKLNRLKPKEDKQIDLQQKSSQQPGQPQQKEKQVEISQEQKQPESIIVKESVPQQQFGQNGVSQKYDISNIKIEGFQEIKKQGKRFIYFNVLYFSNSKQRIVKSERNLKEFNQLRLTLQQTYVDHTLPEVPEKKPNERLTGKEVAARASALEKLLQYIVKYQMSSPFLDKFLEETSGSAVPQDERETNVANIDQVLKDKTFDDFLELRKGSITSKKSLLEMSYNDDSYDPKSSIASAYDPNAYFSRSQIDRRNTAIQFGSDNGYKFAIKEVKVQQGVTFYKIESEINGAIGSTVLRRYNDFKEIYRKFMEKQMIIPVLPNEPQSKTQDMVQYRQEALTKYINQLYQIQEVKTNLVFKEFVGI